MTEPRDAAGRIAVVGGGLAGALLTWRLARAPYALSVDLFTGPPDGFWDDATHASGGLVRGFETQGDLAEAAGASLTELLGDPRLRQWADYRETGAVYALPPHPDIEDLVKTVDRQLPGSVRTVGREELRSGFGLQGLPDDTVGVAERTAGYIAPRRLRDAVLVDLSGPAVRVRHERVAAVTEDRGIRLAEGALRGYDAVVVAAGAWTPRLLAASGLDDQGLRTKQIQYSLFPGRVPGLGTFVDETTGLYGRCTPDGATLLGLPTDRWDVDPSGLQVDAAVAGRVLAVARSRLDLSDLGSVKVTTITAADCYSTPAGLKLRALTPGLFTFTGGSGGAAKTALAASRTAAEHIGSGGWS
ncbi:NAD(P)/FAD-dependent oxidoreductase [Streptomyces purpureus]|uniref:FAD dependent oxidoreductase domain-containing protein n=1 Tax=Streptomyces purpureus TaxID=1951 RepID=A0A918GXT1_9ACTN|nr:FAD-binding oxidoreductase [Streptomyces purpureus]GGT12522.1 hypothetical protein GCM10014713_01170 [Streptomyces purpureus]